MTPEPQHISARDALSLVAAIIAFLIFLFLLDGVFEWLSGEAKTAESLLEIIAERCNLIL